MMMWLFQKVHVNCKKRLDMMDFKFQVFLLCLLTRCMAVNIHRLEVPNTVSLQDSPVTLDCSYTLGDSAGLVVKWFFNGKSNLIYQWIPPLRPQDLGIFKGRLDLDFRISEEPLHAHRALRVRRLSPRMAGNYTCVVSTFHDEDHATKSMMVFSPGTKFELNHYKKDLDYVQLVCYVEDVFPHPILTITSSTRVVEGVHSEVRVDNEGLYDVSARALVPDAAVDPEEFSCELTLPTLNYSARKRTIYYPGAMPTAQLAAVEGAVVKDQQSRGSSPHRGRRYNYTMVFMFSFILINICV